MHRHLRRFSLFAPLSPGDLDDIARVLRVREFRAREPVFLAPDPSKGVYLLMTGCVKVTRGDPRSGKELIVHVVRPGELFGLLARADTGRSNTAAVALHRSTVGHIAGRDIDRLSAKRSFAIGLNRLVGERLAYIASRLDELAFRDVATRLARQLVRLAEDFPGVHDGMPAIDVALTQQDLADLIGATRESTNIALNDLRRGGMIDVHRRLVVIRDLDRLRESAV
jgi:CRP/FNR family transcriptional regulator